MVKNSAPHPARQTGNTVPPGIMETSRREVELTLKVIDGTLPQDLRGHVFLVAPVGSVDDIINPQSQTISKEKGGDSFLNGDGMIYRLDFTSGQAQIIARLVKTPDYYADLATHPKTQNPYHKYRFGNHGITRFSFRLGLRNQLNTAFLTLRFGKSAPDRLLVAYDAGRPYELDPVSLEVVTPVGFNQDWIGELDKIPIFKKFPFKSILSTAHPGFDYQTGTMFTVNYGRSLLNLLLTIPLIDRLVNLPTWLKTILTIGLAALTIYLWNSSGLVILNILGTILFFGILLLFNKPLLARFNPIGRMLADFTDILIWDGQSNLQRWSLMVKNDQGELQPVSIEQTIHQVGVTQNYIVIMDTAFIAGITQLLNGLPRWFRKLFERDPNPNSTVYLIRRADLLTNQNTVIVQKIVIPQEAAHFLVDYDDMGDKITLHVAHLNGMQVADWLRKCDVSKITGESVQAYLHGMQHDETDLGRVGRYVVCGKTGALLTAQVLAHAQCTWAVDLYAYQDRHPNGEPVLNLKQIYWASFGLWTDLMTQYIYNAYRDYEYRLIPLTEILELARQGQPAALFRLDTESLTIGDYYNFPTSTMALSPQFIPRGDESLPTEGYLSCVVFAGTQSQIWIFDGSNLKQGPICKLAHEDLDMGFTLHTVWLRSIQARQSDYNVPVREDYQPLVSQNNQQIQELFNREVYPHFLK